MTQEQFDRWQDFALRMARTCYATARRPSGKWVESVVLEFFAGIDAVDIQDIVDWDSGPSYIGDAVTNLLYDYEPRRPECRACSGDDEDGECQCDEIEQLFSEQWDEQWGGPVRCCIRAGLDCASAPSAGVIGFNAGDVRRMYPEGVPDWVFPPNERLYYWLSDEINGTFAELLDTAEVVL